MKQKNIRKPGRIGIFCVAHPVYWPQFEGLRETLLGYHETLRQKVTSCGAEVVDFGIVDDSRTAYDLVSKIQSADVDVLFCNMVTYATSSVFAPIIRDVDKPMVLTALQPLDALDYTKANTRMQLENDAICSVPEFTSVAIRLGKKVEDVIIGKLTDDKRVDDEISEWCAIAAVLRALRGARIGLMGHVLNTMYDMHADPTAVSAAFGVHVPLLEIDDVIRVGETVTEDSTEFSISGDKLTLASGIGNAGEGVTLTRVK